MPVFLDLKKLIYNWGTGVVKIPCAAHESLRLFSFMHGTPCRLVVK